MNPSPNAISNSTVETSEALNRNGNETNNSEPVFAADAIIGNVWRLIRRIGLGQFSTIPCVS